MPEYKKHTKTKEDISKGQRSHLRGTPADHKSGTI